MARKKRPYISTDAVVANIIATGKRAAMETLEHRFDYCFEACESPIERLFAAALIHPETASEYDSHMEVVRPLSGLIANVVPPPIAGLYLYPQIRIGDYRVDFVLASVGFGETRTLIVECDGHDFHERTKYQAQRDKARDRYIVGQGYRLLRFTGSEVYADAYACAHEALTTLLDLR